MEGERHRIAVGVPFAQHGQGQVTTMLAEYRHCTDEENSDEIEWGRCAEASRQNQLLKRVQLHSFLYGIFVGFFVECGALIAHVLYQTVQWNHRNPSPSEILIFSLTWASITSMLPCVALMFLRSLLLTSSRLTTLRGQYRKSPQLDLVVWNLESRFGIGSFLGVSSAATLLDVILGLRSHIFLTASLLTMVVGSFTCMTTGYGHILRPAQRLGCNAPNESPSTVTFLDAEYCSLSDDDSDSVLVV